MYAYLLEQAIQSFYLEGIEFNKDAWNWYKGGKMATKPKNATPGYKALAKKGKKKDKKLKGDK